MQTVTTIGLDIAKSVFQVHGIDAEGKVVITWTHGARPHVGIKSLSMSMAASGYLKSRSRQAKLQHYARRGWRQLDATLRLRAVPFRYS
jgi:transposase